MPELDDAQKEERRQRFILATEAYSVCPTRKSGGYDRELEGASPQQKPARPSPREAKAPPAPPSRPAGNVRLEHGREMMLRKIHPLFQMCSNTWRDARIRPRSA